MKKIPICFDNGGTTFDRLTLICGESRQHGRRFLIISSSETGSGFWMHGEIKAADITINGRVSFAHLGKRVKFSELSPEVQARYKQELPFLAEEYTLPGWALAPIVNGDYSTLNDGEDEILTEFLNDIFEQYGQGHWSIGEERNEFSRNDIDNYWGETYKGKYLHK